MEASDRMTSQIREAILARVDALITSRYMYFLYFLGLLEFLWMFQKFSVLILSCGKT